MSHSSNGHELFAYMLICGPAMLACGLANLKKERLLQDTPLSKVRSAAMGLIALQGIAKPRREIFEPLEKATCCWWRCQVQEYRSNGKSGSWVTIKELDSAEHLYVQDDTGKVLVDPHGAELYIDDKVVSLHAWTRPKIEPVLNAWGINDESWFGMTKKMRLIEKVILPDFPLYILGLLDQFEERSQIREDMFEERLESIKQDPQKMAGVLGPDGVIDAMAWDVLVKKEQEIFMGEEAAREAQIPESDKLVVRKPDDQPFVISLKSEQELAQSVGIKAWLLVICGIAIAGLGTALALANNISEEWTVVLVIGGFIVGMIVARPYSRSVAG